MIALVAAGLLVLGAFALAEARTRRARRRDRLAALEALARAAGVIAAVKVGRALGWVGDDDVRSDGEHVQIRLRR